MKRINYALAFLFCLSILSSCNMWPGNQAGKKVVVYGDSLTDVSKTQVQTTLNVNYRTVIRSHGGYRYDQLIPFNQQVITDYGQAGAGEVVVVEAGTNDAAQAVDGTFDISTEQANASQFLTLNPQAKCFVYVTGVTYIDPALELNPDAVTAAEAMITTHNQWIYNLASTNPKVRVADYTQMILAQGVAPDYNGTISPDHLHPTPTGAQLYANLLRDTIATC